MNFLQIKASACDPKKLLNSILVFVIFSCSRTDVIETWNKLKEEEEEKSH